MSKDYISTDTRSWVYGVFCKMSDDEFVTELRALESSRTNYLPGRHTVQKSDKLNDEAVNGIHYGPEGVAGNQLWNIPLTEGQIQQYMAQIMSRKANQCRCLNHCYVYPFHQFS